MDAIADLGLRPDPAPERTPVPPFDLVIFGAGGDLALRKLFPALAQRNREGVLPRLDGQIAFDARVAANVLDLVAREMRLSPAAARREEERLAQLLGREGSLEDLNGDLCARIRDGRIDPASPALREHLRATTLDKLAVDQPSYATFAQVEAEGWTTANEEPWPEARDEEDRPGA